MASHESTVDFLAEQMNGAGVISSRKMFGEYVFYCDAKVVALVCDDALYVKPTVGGRKFLSICDEKPPYPGAKPYFLVSGERWDDADWLTTLIQITAAELPVPKKKGKFK